MQLTVDLYNTQTQVSPGGDILFGLGSGSNNKFLWNIQSHSFTQTPEPDFAIWRDSDSGLPCAIKRTPRGHLCGYVGIGPSCLLYGVDMAEDMVSGHDTYSQIDVHGGVTFTGPLDWFCTYTDVDEQLDDTMHTLVFRQQVWFIGFDAAHFQDWSPGFRTFSSVENYKNFQFMEDQCKHLAKQLFLFRNKRATAK